MNTIIAFVLALLNLVPAMPQAKQPAMRFWLDCTQVGDNQYDCDGGQL